MNPANSSEGRILVLEPEEQLASAILKALHEVAPGAIVDLARSVEDAQRMVVNAKPDLFVLDVDATHDLGQDFLYDLRTSHPNARAIILTAVHLAAARERVAGLGAIHFLEKPFPHSDFLDLVGALLRPDTKPDSEKFQATLSDLHVADIIQLKCMSGATAGIEVTGPKGEKGRVYFENGQVRHATAGDKQGMEAFSDIVTWKGGRISEIPPDNSTRTITGDWQMLLMEAARQADETAAAAPGPVRRRSSSSRRVLVVDDSLMLLSFVKEILAESHYLVTTAPTATEGLAAAKGDPPDLILLDYVLPDMRGDEFVRQLAEDQTIGRTPVIYMSGLGSDLRPPDSNGSVIGFLNKPFTSDLLIKTVEMHMPQGADESPAEPGAEQTSAQPAGAEPFAPAPAPMLFAEPAESPSPEQTPATAPATDGTAATSHEWWSAPQNQTGSWPEPTPATPGTEMPQATADLVPATEAVAAIPENAPDESVTGGSYFCGDTRFFSLGWALQTISKGQLTGTLRSFWSKQPVDLFARNGQILLVTTRDPDLYCSEAPITLVNVDAEKINEAKNEQRQSGRPLFMTLAQGGHILQEPAMQLVQHYGQKLFAELWTAPYVRFSFEQSANLPDYTRDIPVEPEADQWALASLRMIQSRDLGNRADYDPASIPAYTRDGFERIQRLRLTVGEAQFASQFNGVRSIAQIAKNLRLDIKLARLTLFRCVALDIIECWPPATAAKPERKGVFQRLSRTIGIGE